MPSADGAHSSLALTMRPFEEDKLIVLATVQMPSNNTVQVSFLDMHLNSMKVVYARPCYQNKRTPINKEQTMGVVRTFLDAPSRVDHGVIAVTGTCGDSEAEFL